MISVAFAGELALEELEESRANGRTVTLDGPDSDEEEGDAVDMSPEEIGELQAREQDLLDSVPLPGVPVQEADRRKRWLKIPRKARAAIRKMHRDWGHLPRGVLKVILKAAKAPKEYIDAAEYLRCEDSISTAKPSQTSKTAPPKPYVFNNEIGVDVLDLHDYEGKCHLFLNIVDQGTNFQMVVWLREGAGQPKSRECAEAFMERWVSWAGWPKNLVCDRGLHNRGRFSRMLGAHGICPRNIGLESPEQLGRTERHGDIWKMNAKRVIRHRKVRGSAEMRMLACENNSVMNENIRKGGFSPAQWVLGKNPRDVGSIFDEDEHAHLGVVSERIDPESAFQRKIELRLACKKAFAENDCSKRIASNILRKAAPIPMDYSVGDLVSFKRKQGARTQDELWSTPTRLIGFDGEKIAWGLCEGVPVCVATDKIRPCTAAESMAYLYLHQHNPRVDYNPGLDGEQQNYVDVRDNEPKRRRVDPDEGESPDLTGLELDAEDSLPIDPDLIDDESMMMKRKVWYLPTFEHCRKEHIVHFLNHRMTFREQLYNTIPHSLVHHLQMPFLTL